MDTAGTVADEVGGGSGGDGIAPPQPVEPDTQASQSRWLERKLSQHSSQTLQPPPAPGSHTLASHRAAMQPSQA